MVGTIKHGSYFLHHTLLINNKLPKLNSVKRRIIKI